MPKIFTSPRAITKVRGYLSPHFRISEFTCNHCGALPMDCWPPQTLLDTLELVRGHFDKPVVVYSGYRCPTHNRNVGGAKNSYHMLGMAADIAIHGIPARQVYAWLDPIHKGGLGSYATFTHVDVRPFKARW